VLLTNLISGMQEMSRQVDRRGLDIDANKRKIARLLLEPESRDEFDPKPFTKIQTLWADKAIQEVWKDPDLQIQLSSFSYLIGCVDRYAQPDFVPNNDDILRARQRTSGINRVQFTKEKFKWELVDVGKSLV